MSHVQFDALQKYSFYRSFSDGQKVTSGFGLYLAQWLPFHTASLPILNSCSMHNFVVISHSELDKDLMSSGSN